MAYKARMLMARLPMGLVIVFLAVTILVPIMAAQPARADICADTPRPVNPWDHDLSMIYRPALDGDGNIIEPRPHGAFGENRDTTPALMYGTEYKFIAYDASCNWGTDSLFTFAADTDSKMFAFAEYPVSFAAIASKFTLDSSWRDSLDGAVDGVVKELGSGIFGALAGLMILLGGVAVLLGARKGDLGKAMTNVLWIFVIVAGVGVTMASPAKITDTADDAIMSVVDTGVGALPGSPNKDGENPSSEEKVYGAIDPINTDVLYRNWQIGQFGSADGVAAKKYGGAFFVATHLSWHEGKIVRDDPTGEGQKIIDEKERQFKDVMSNIEKEDPTAFEYIKGKNTSRLGSTMTAILQSWLTLPFFIIGMLSVGVALLTIKIVVMLLPMILLGGLFEPSRNWMLSILQKYSGNIVRAPITFVAALANAAIVSAIYKSDAPAFGKLLLAVVTMVILWGIAKPQVTPMPLARTGASAIKKIVTLVAAKKFMDSRATKNAPSPAPTTPKPSASQAPVAQPTAPMNRRVAASPVRGALPAGTNEVPVRRVDTEAAQQPAPGVPVSRQIGGPPQRVPQSHRLDAGAVPTSSAPTKQLGTGASSATETSAPAAGTTSLPPTVIPVGRRLPGASVPAAQEGEGAPQAARGSGPVGSDTGQQAPQQGSGYRELPSSTPGAPGAAAGDAQGAATASGAQSSSQQPMADTSWQANYETLELRDDARGPDGSGGTVIFTPKNAQREKRQGGVSEGNLSYSEGKPQFTVWSPAENAPGNGSRTQGPRDTNGPAA